MCTVTTHIALLAGFIATIALGGMFLSEHANKPGSAGDVLLNLCDFERVQSSNSVGTLILAVHPRCPCTVATVRGLARLPARFSSQFEILAYAFCPPGEPEFCADSSIVDTLAALPNARVVVDLGGAAAQELGLRTSGHVLYYNRRGHLVFSGGITASRGHEGPCRAATELLKRIAGTPTDLSSWPVFGCPLFTDVDTKR